MRVVVPASVKSLNGDDPFPVCHHAAHRRRVACLARRRLALSCSSYAALVPGAPVHARRGWTTHWRGIGGHLRPGGIHGQAMHADAGGCCECGRSGGGQSPLRVAVDVGPVDLIAGDVG